MLATIEVLTPYGALVGVAALAPLLALIVSRRRVLATRATLGLRAPGLPRDLAAAASIAAVGLLAAAAAAQPVLRSVERTSGRSDVAVLVVVDTSRSMLAAPAPGAPNRLERARRIAGAVRSSLDEVPVGVASLSDRVLPHLFPTLDKTVFTRVLQGPIRGGHPPPAGGFGASSSLNALAKLGEGNIFAETVANRLVLVLTDAESDPLDSAALRAALHGTRPLDVAVVLVGRSGEQVYDSGGLPEPGYRPRPGAESSARRVAALAGGRFFGEAEAAAVVGWAVGRTRSPTRATEADVLGVERRELAPLLMAAAAVPLLLLVLLRGVPIPAGRRRFPGTLGAAWRRSSAG